MFEAIQNSLLILGPFSDEEVSLLVGKLRVLFVAKGSFLLREGQVCQATYFINRGSFRQYQSRDDSDEITLNLLVGNEWALDYQSFISQKPSKASIQANEDSEVFELNIHDIHALIGTSTTFFSMGRLLERVLASMEIRTKSMSPEMKYRQLLATRPQVVQQFALKYIASYLNITPETLSRVRKKLSRSADFLI